MPELPEVEVVRAGLAPAVTGARVAAVEVVDARSLKRHLPEGADRGSGGHGVTLMPEVAAARSADFERRLTGARLEAPERRGKFIWIPVGVGGGVEPGAPTAPRLALLAHLGMSGQLLLRAHEAPDDRHVRIRIWIEHPQHGGLRLDFVDQRRFGSLALDPLVSFAGAAGADGQLAAIPSQALHIAQDPLDPAFDDRAFVTALRSRRVAVKSALLDQGMISGVGNIYADEALWRVRLHPETPGERIGPRSAAALLAAVRDVFAQALAEGGTSFDAQYVNVNGQAGHFSRYLHSYGRMGEPCDRCGTPIKRIPFGGRSSHFCPRCQRKPSHAST